MAAFRPIICFDASAINRLADDPDASVLQALLAGNYFSRITSTNLEEIGANQNSHRKQRLHEIMNPLVLWGMCFAAIRDR